MEGKRKDKIIKLKIKTKIMPNFKEDPEGYGSAFQMNGHALPGPFQQVQARPENMTARAVGKHEAQLVRAAQGGPIEQRLAKNNSQAATNKAEMEAVRTAQGGPIEQRLTPPPGWRAERQAPSAPSAPSAASLDYVNPTENSSPVEQTDPTWDQVKSKYDSYGAYKNMRKNAGLTANPNNPNA